MIRCRLGAGGALSRLCRGTSLQTLSLVLLVLVVVCRPCQRVNHLDHCDYQNDIFGIFLLKNPQQFVSAFGR